MNNNIKNTIIILVVLTVGAAIGRFSLPAKTIVKTQVQTVTKEVVKTVEIDKTDYYKNKVLIETTTTKPDGTIIKEREFVDKSVVVKDEEKNTTNTTNSSTTSNSTTEKIYNNNNASARVIVARNASHLSEDIYGLQLEKKIIGPFTIGVLGLTDKTIGLSLGMGF